ncbi:MAG: hypothetical protein GWP59_02765 [Chlamydiales bacterium]|nr:hypothetical protein [Chlamydiales bacterium]
MLNPTILEKSYQKYIQNLPECVPDGILDVDISILHNCGLLGISAAEPIELENSLSHYFHVIESAEKITLFNQEFVIWIVPIHSPSSSGEEEEEDILSRSYVLLAINDNSEPNLEMVFSTSGIYNNSKFIIGLIEHFIEDIKENEKLFDDFKDII